MARRPLNNIIITLADSRLVASRSKAALGAQIRHFLDGRRILMKTAPYPSSCGAR